MTGLINNYTVMTRSNKRKEDGDECPNKRRKIDDEIVKRVIYDTNSSDDNYESSDEEQNNNGCINPLCDHKNGPPITMQQITIESLDDLIEIGKKYHCKRNRRYNDIDLKILCDLIVPLSELKNLIGMTSVKKNIMHQIIFSLEGFNKNTKCGNCMKCSCGLTCDNAANSDMLHTIITGPPGVGKTELGRILGKIYKAMGILSNGDMKIATRSDLIGLYLGSTAQKVQKFINSCKGGVMFIDEAYALGNPEGRDSFSKECLDTLNQNMSERRDFLVIIAGYKDALDKCFFNFNDGLKRRFSFRYDIEGYTSSEIMEIFMKKVEKDGWDLEINPKKGDDNEQKLSKDKKRTELANFFKTNKEFFPHFGGDAETLFLNCKIAHAKRVFLGPKNEKKILTNEDIKIAFDTFIGHRKYKEKKDDKPPYGMYL